MYWNEDNRTLIFFKEDQFPQYVINVEKKIPISDISLHHFTSFSAKHQKLVREASIVKYYDDETLEFRCFKNRYGKGF